MTIRQRLSQTVINLIRSRHGVVVFYGDKERRDDLTTIARVRLERKLLLSDHEAHQLMRMVRSTAKVPGDIAEVGTFRGVSAKLIAEARGNHSKKTLFLFDTFEGLPELQDIDRAVFHKGQYGAGMYEVADYLGEYPDIALYSGIFPQSAGPIEQKKFSFVHLDVDLYQSTKEALAFFYPRMAVGGVIVSHDYLVTPGATKAVVEFMADKPEPILESSWRQCVIVKSSG
ncbi:MAG: class I SAM-dependent methyltransferase [Candidatus Pacebacteria bacterium]|nr:class I SAM-dependent methyltransferase [Candidatus Paceibacterota bacterium]